MAKFAWVVEYTNSPAQTSGYDIKKSYGEASVMLELWAMWTTPSLLLLAGPLCPGAVAPDKILSMGQIEMFDI